MTKISDKEKIRIRKKMKELGYDTAVRCDKCDKVEYLQFKNGMKNGWSKCCGYTMSIVVTITDIKKESDKLFSRIDVILKGVRDEFGRENNV